MATPSPRSASPPKSTDGQARVGPGYADRKVNLVALARMQRRTLMLAVAELIWFGCIVFSAVFEVLPRTAYSLLFVRLILSVGMGASIGHWMQIFRFPDLLSGLGGILGMIPILNMIAIRTLDVDSRHVFSRFGVRCGVLGLDAAARHQLRHGVCGACGYSMHGLPSTICPECGQDQSREAPKSQPPPNPTEPASPQ